jgi:hypothetical protein
MDPTAQLVADYLEHRDRHPGLGADADPLFPGPNHSRLTRSGVAKLLARHGTVNFTLIMIYFAKANTKCGGRASSNGLHPVFALAK